jgi:hypothetical protein
MAVGIHERESGQFRGMRSDFLITTRAAASA